MVDLKAGAAPTRRRNGVYSGRATGAALRTITTSPINRNSPFAPSCSISLRPSERMSTPWLPQPALRLTINSEILQVWSNAANSAMHLAGATTKTARLACTGKGDSECRRWELSPGYTSSGRIEIVLSKLEDWASMACWG